jgi:hypothetical protein
MGLNKLLCGKVLHGIGEETPESHLIRQAEKDGILEVNKFKNCFILFRKLDSESTLGYLVFEAFDKSTVSAMQKMLNKHSDKRIMAKTAFPRMERFLCRLGFKATGEVHDGERIMWKERI